MDEEKLLIVLRSLSLIRLTKYLCQDVTVSRTACTFIYGTSEAWAATEKKSEGVGGR